jgi:hypothetical protein
MVYRAEKLGIMDERSTRQLWIRFSRHGWRAKEPGTVRADRAIRFERLLDSAISQKRLTWSEAGMVTGMPLRELKRRRNRAMGITDEAEEGGVVFNPFVSE